MVWENLFPWPKTIELHTNTSIQQSGNASSKPEACAANSSTQELQCIILKHLSIVQTGDILVQDVLNHKVQLQNLQRRKKVFPYNAVAL